MSPYDNQTLMISSRTAFRIAEGCVEATVGGLTHTLPVLAMQIALEFESARYPSDVRRTPPWCNVPAVFDEQIQRLVQHRILTAAPSACLEQTILDILHPRVAESSSFTRIWDYVSSGRAVAIRNAFREDFAARVHSELNQITAWAPVEYNRPERPYFQFRQHGLNDPAELPDSVGEWAAIMGSSATKGLLSQASGCDCTGAFRYGATVYYPGDYSFPHNDNGGMRALTYIWYLAKDWREDWGGHFVWCPTGTMITPEFNLLLLFKVTDASLHFVTQVSGRSLGKRLSVNGWWERPDAAPDGRPASSRVAGVKLASGKYGAPAQALSDCEGVVLL